MKNIITIAELIFLLLLIIATEASDVNQLGNSKFKNFFVYIKALSGLILIAYLAFGIFLYVKYVILKLISFSSPLPWILIILLSIVAVIFLGYHLIKYLKSARDRKNTEYYREIPETCSTAIASYLINQHLEKKKDLFSTIISLVSKKAIDIIPSNNSYTYKPKNSVNLKEDEKYVYDWLFSDNKKEFSLASWQDIVKKELITNDLIRKEEKNIGLYKILFVIWFSIILIIGILYWRTNITSDNFQTFLTIFLYPALFILPAFGMLNKLQVKFNEYVLSERGKSIYSKLKALRKFLKDFSIINRRASEEVYVWKEYLAFALALNVNIDYKKIKSLNMPFLTNIQEKELFEDTINKLAQLGDND